MSARPFTESEYNTIVQYLRAESRHRDALLMVLGCSTGFRIKELLSLSWDQVWDGTGARHEVMVARRNLKGGSGAYARHVRSRRVPLNERVRTAIAEYAVSLPHPPLPHALVFRTSRSGGSPMDRSTAFRLLAGSARACGIPSIRVSTHSLRKTFVGRIYSASGNDLIKTQRIVGHASPVTTARYLETDSAELDSLVRGLAA